MVKNCTQVQRLRWSLCARWHRRAGIPYSTRGASRDVASLGQSWPILATLRPIMVNDTPLSALVQKEVPQLGRVVEDATTEQVKIRASIGLALEHLDPVYLALDLALAVW
jgi:hypothetical protein